MATFKVKPKNQSDIEKKPRVYFTCHPEDFEKHFEKICQDLFRTHDCAVYYTEDMSEPIPDEEKEVDLGRNNLFVVPVTFRLLFQPNRAMDEDIPYAMAHHIPILPIMMESDLIPLYSRPDKFGALQYLEPDSQDQTAIAYEDKLKKYLESVLISDELAQRVRAAFDAYIFLSYRKKDRRYANQLMRLIHSNREYRDIAIWFDEFLTPGENFKESIEKIIDDCALFALLVTPRLLEKGVDAQGQAQDNYVLSTELPLARRKKAEKGIDILAVEMEATDRGALAAKEIYDCVNIKDPAFRIRLAEAALRIATRENDTPEHNFLIGLAYLEGIYMEVDRVRGLELITSAAEADLYEAMEKLYDIYYNGIGVPVDYRQALKWIWRIVDYHKKQYGEEAPQTIAALNHVGLTLNALGEYRMAQKVFETLYQSACRAHGKEDPNTLATLNNLALVHNSLREHQEALPLFEEVCHLTDRVWCKDHPYTLTALQNLAFTYGQCKAYTEAVKMFEEIYERQCRVLGEDHPDTLLTMNNWAQLCCNLHDFENALALGEKTYTKRCKVLGKEHPDTLMTLHNLAGIHIECDDLRKAKALLKEVYDLRCKVLGEEHPSTLICLDNLARTCRRLGEPSKHLFQKLYDQQRRVFGDAHPGTLATLGVLAAMAWRDGELRKAFVLYANLYEQQCATLGPKHPDTLTSLYNMAFISGDLGGDNLDHSLVFYEQVYTQRCEVLGEEHPDTLTTLHDLAFTYCAAKKYREALEAYNRVYPLRCKVLGETHPHTLMSLHNLAVTYDNIAFTCDDIEAYENAMHRYEQAYTQRCEVLGQDHPDTLETLNNLLVLYDNLTTAHEKREAYRNALLVCEKSYVMHCGLLGREHPHTLKVRCRMEEIRSKI